MVRAVIFDLDGVLVRTDELHFASWQAIADEEKIPFGAAQYDARMRGVGRMRALEVLLEQAPRRYAPEEKAQLARRKNECYLQLLREQPPQPIEGARELIAAARQAGLKVGVASSSKNARLILEALELMPLVDSVVDGYSEPSKPDPKVFLETAAALNVSPAECVVIEDSADGVQAARSAGMHVLAVGPPDRFDRIEHCEPSLGSVNVERLLAAAGQ